ncbi:Retrovirus-related Pol polyprotein from transposon 297 [Araneus ventricosus]|uniref:RNA-directed DNA polymerase n=1 Tax=Araneus ventricosus TaxID=182803 RepID=A0A4Y2CXM6_ARAVE|nr:Retrovirus-related Pol polyprotein from transposon 297 [Araneus ventricosus]
MKEEARHFTAFVTHSGHFQWKVLPFDMKNAGSTFQRSMNKALAPHREYCRSYIDDVPIYSQSWRDHLLHIESVFRSLREVGLTVNLEKCAFGHNQVKFLGHIVGSGQHSPDPEKAEVLRNLSRPSTKKELRSFLGLASYYRDYIPNFSEIVLPLTDLSKGKVSNILPWSIEAEEAFVKIKDELIRMPTLHTLDISRPFWLYTDASATAIGTCLAQQDDVGKELPIAFFSKKLTLTQMKWSIIEREALCVLEALKKFDTWVFGGKIQAVSDHNPLTYLTNSAPYGAKLSRWALALQIYNLTISYRKSIQHENADVLSRLAIDSVK